MDRFDELKTDLAHIESDISAFKAAVDSRAKDVDRRFDDVDRRFDDVDRRFDDVDRRFDDVDKRFDDVDRRFDELRTELIQYIAEATSHTAKVLGAQLERHARSAADDFRSFMVAIDDKYRHLPSAFDKLRGDVDDHVADDSRHFSKS